MLKKNLFILLFLFTIFSNKVFSNPALISISGNKYFSKESIIKLAGLKKVQNKEKIDTNTIIRNLFCSGYIRRIKFSFDTLNSILNIKIKERLKRKWNINADAGLQLYEIQDKHPWGYLTLKRNFYIKDFPLKIYSSLRFPFFPKITLGLTHYGFPAPPFFFNTYISKSSLPSYYYPYQTGTNKFSFLLGRFFSTRSNISSYASYEESSTYLIKNIGKLKGIFAPMFVPIDNNTHKIFEEKIPSIGLLYNNNSLDNQAYPSKGFNFQSLIKTEFIKTEIYNDNKWTRIPDLQIQTLSIDTKIYKKIATKHILSINLTSTLRTKTDSLHNHRLLVLNSTKDIRGSANYYGNNTGKISFEYRKDIYKYNYQNFVDTNLLTNKMNKILTLTNWNLSSSAYFDIGGVWGRTRISNSSTYKDIDFIKVIDKPKYSLGLIFSLMYPNMNRGGRIGMVIFSKENGFTNPNNNFFNRFIVSAISAI